MTVPQCGPQRLQPCDMSGEFEDPEDSEDPEDLRGLGDILQGVLRGELVEDQRDKEREDPEEVDYIQK